MTTESLTHVPRTTPDAAGAAAVRGEAGAAVVTTRLRPAYSLTAAGPGLGVQVKASERPC